MAGVVSDSALVGDVLRQAGPNALSSLAMVLVAFVTILFVSRHEDSDTLGGVGMGTMLYNVLGLSLGVGVTSALDTLVSQSNGAGHYRQSGIWLQRTAVMATAVCIPACLVLSCTESVLVMIGQDAAIARHAGDYVLATLPSMWPMYMANALAAYLRAQKLPQATMYVTWLSNAFHVLSCQFFIVLLGWGAWGAGLAFTCTQWLSFLSLLAFIQVRRPGVTKESWIKWDWQQATRGTREYLELAMPCAMLMWAEWWCAEVATLLAGFLGVASLAAHTSVMQCFVLIYMTSGGVGGAGAALVGNAIGAGDASLARRSAWIAAAVIAAASVVIDAGLLFNADAIAASFTQDPEVHAEMVTLLRILLVVVPLDCLQTVIDGVLRGLGKQSLAFKIKIVCMWGVRFPVAWWLGLHTSLGVYGVWLGTAAGLAATMAVYVPTVLRVDWEAEASGCRYRKMSDEVGDGDCETSPGSMGSSSATTMVAVSPRADLEHGPAAMAVSA